MVKNGCGQSGYGTLNLTVFEEWTDGIHKLIFLHVGTWSQKLKADEKSFGLHSQKWVWSVWSQGSKINSGIKSIFYAGKNSGKLIQLFMVGVVKNGHGLLFHEILISVIP